MTGLEIPVSPALMRVLAVLVFAAGACFAVGGLCDLASADRPPRRHELW
jgi:hypothetical protein